MEMRTDTDLCLWRGFQVAQATAMERIEAEFAALGLPSRLPHHDVLIALSRAPEGRLRVGELAGDVAVKRSWLSRVIDQLETDGLVCRATCPSDRRGAFVVLTPEGREMVARALPVYRDAVRRHFARYMDDPSALRASLARMVDTGRI
ncbi:MAG: MarR family transcriptional regulator [Thermoleophilia bacterium]